MSRNNLKKQRALIEQIGTVALMEMFDVTKGAISQWRQKGIPNARLMYLELRRPDLFVESEKTTSSNDHARRNDEWLQN